MRDRRDLVGYFTWLVIAAAVAYFGWQFLVR